MPVVPYRPHWQYTVLHWQKHDKGVDLQVDANGRFVSNNIVFTIIFFNTYYHNWMNKIAIAASNETFSL